MAIFNRKNRKDNSSIEILSIIPVNFDLDEENGCLNIELNPEWIEENGLEVIE